MKKKKIIILSCKIGNGHLSPAQATMQALEHLFPNKYEIEIIDFFKLANETISKITKKALYASIKYAPGIYKMLYEQFDKKTQMKLLNLLQFPLVYKRIQKFLSSKSPDLILSVYPIWDHSLAMVNKKNAKAMPFVSLVTDSINVHQVWLTADVDYHIVVNKETAKRLEKMGIEKEKIKVTGLPVRLQFLEKIDKKAVFKKYKLDGKYPLILFIATAENSKKLCREVEETAKYHPEKNIIVITGNNKDGYKALKKLKLNKNIQIFAFRDDIHELMKSADIVVGKAGGGVVQECIACKTPMIITQVIPGHEEGNAKLIRKHKLGIDITHQNIKLTTAVNKILKNKKEYQANLKKHSKPRAALEVAKFLDSLI